MKAASIKRVRRLLDGERAKIIAVRLAKESPDLTVSRRALAAALKLDGVEGWRDASQVLEGLAGWRKKRKRKRSAELDKDPCWVFVGGSRPEWETAVE